MTREQKLALIIGFSLVLLVGVLVSDHLSGARSAQLADVGAALETSAPPPLADPLPEFESPEPLPAPTFRPTQTVPTDQIAAAPETRSHENDIAGADESSSQSFLRSLQEQFRQTSEAAPPAAQVDRDETIRPNLPEPRVADPLVEDRRAPAIAQYRVKKGDSVWSIAESRYGDGRLAAKLAEYNVERGRMRDADTLLVGATILLPEPRALGASGSRLAQATPEPAKPRAYTVRKGDTLGEIAQRVLGSSREIDAILAANRTVIDDPDDIRVGMILRIPS